MSACFVGRRARVLVLGLVLLLSLVLGGCAYRDRVAPLDLPDPERGAVEINGVMVSAVAFVDPKQAQEAFGFNARRAGLLPVQLTFQNDSRDEVVVNTGQTFLVDQENRAWPVLSLERAHARAKGHVEVGETMREAGRPALLLGAAGAVVGAAFALVTGENVGSAAGKGAAIGVAGGVLAGGAEGYADIGARVRRDLAEKSLTSGPIRPNQIGYGVLFFPGEPGAEADTVEELRLALQIGREQHIIRLSLR
ncbi:hypothetical protein [Desulfurivibrio alkaliphilus]|uniref:Uncharacterized protein n=1 Tax=Desulfurivibrio alkaliphilus (strain DSM 19089 / UNIQEM U267 / AHT2) TaxID=589865 RepID=D6Z3R4_DESAT|nr:hypothetical protein [Desulfurivibrio alkaliphilus]ADH86189.1 conserved hypothetical protein [Desulfurivibrio alkaliphilus AHT 2]